MFEQLRRAPIGRIHGTKLGSRGGANGRRAHHQRPGRQIHIGLDAQLDRPRFQTPGQGFDIDPIQGSAEEHGRKPQQRRNAEYPR